MTIFNNTLRLAIGMLVVAGLNFQLMGQSVVEIRFAKQTVEVGEVVSAWLRIETPIRENGVWISKDSMLVGVNTLFEKDSLNYEPLADFQILDYGLFLNYIQDGRITLPTDKKQEGNLSRVVEDSIRLQFYNPGEFLCFGPTLIGLLHSNLSRKPEVLTVTVPEALAAKDSLSLQPIKDILYEPATFMDYLPWVVIVLLLILLVVGIVIYLKKMRGGESTPKEPIQPDVKPYELALKALQDLKDSSYWLIAGDKEFQTAFTLILREYIARRYKLPALEMTSDEILRSLKLKGLSEAQLFTLHQMLQLADLVKFANASTPEPMYQEFLVKAIAFVDTTKPMTDS
jgi:hypothetical protein